MRPAIYDSMTVSVDVAGNGLVITCSVTASSLGDPIVERMLVAMSNSQALSHIEALVAEGMDLLGTDVPVSHTATKIRL